MQTKKTLYILRHAKAEIGGAAQEDHDRGLDQQGIDACAVMGKYLVDHKIGPELVLCSTAKRVRETWSLVGKAYGKSLPEEYTERLYLASANEIVNQLALLPDSMGSVMVVAHNPGLHELAMTLAHQGDEALLDKLAIKYPTCAFAAIELDTPSWKGVARANGTLKIFITPKMITG